MTTIKVILLTGISAIWVRYVFYEHIIKCTMVSVLFSAFILAGDSVFLAGLEILMQRDVLPYLQNPYGYYLFCYIMKVMELFLIIVLQRSIHGRTRFQNATWNDWLRTIAFPGLSVIISIVLFQLYTAEPDFAPQLLFCSIVLVVTDLLAILLLNHLDEQQQAMHDYSILKHSIKLEQDNVTAWMNAYSNQRKQTHEFQNQLAVICGLAQQEAPSGRLLQYVNQLLQTDLSESLFVKTGRAVVDVILNQKYAIAQSKGITLQVQLDDLRDFALPDDTLVVVLSNLIDNAIEACEKIDDSAARVIHLKMRADPEVNFLYIDNPTATAVKIIDNCVVTTKKNISEHGYGLKNIATLLGQHDADYVLDYQEETHLFCFSAQIIPPGT